MLDVVLNGSSAVVSDDVAFAQDQQMGAHLLHHLQHVRTIEDRPALLAQCLDQVLQHQRRSYVEPEKRLIENENFGIVHERGNEQDTLPHSLRIRSDRRMAVGI